MFDRILDERCRNSTCESIDLSFIDRLLAIGKSNNFRTEIRCDRHQLQTLLFQL